MRTIIFGCGYLGRRVASAWIARRHEVFAVTRSPKNAESFRESGIQPIIGDVCDFSSLRNLPKVDIALHSIGFDRSSGKSQEEVTRGGMQNVLSALRGGCDRFIHVSSTSVYGQSDGEWVDEDSECHPTQPNGQLTLAAEELVRDAVDSQEINCATVFRLAGIYGPGRLLSRIETLRSGQPFSGRADSWLNLIHVDDAALAILTCTRSGLPVTIYNVVDDRPIERREYFGQLAKLVGAPEPTFDATQPRVRGSGGLNKRCSNRKLKQDLGWLPVHASIVTGLSASIDAPDSSLKSGATNATNEAG